MDTIHEQKLIVVTRRDRKTPVRIWCDASIAKLISELNHRGANTCGSCEDCDEQGTIQIVFQAGITSGILKDAKNVCTRRYPDRVVVCMVDEEYRFVYYLVKQINTPVPVILHQEGYPQRTAKYVPLMSTVKPAVYEVP